MTLTRASLRLRLGGYSHQWFVVTMMNGIDDDNHSYYYYYYYNDDDDDDSLLAFPNVPLGSLLLLLLLVVSCRVDDDDGPNGPSRTTPSPRFLHKRSDWRPERPCRPHSILRSTLLLTYIYIYI